ncbi:MAG: LysE family translocator [Acetobacteraceae bacterium]|nr:LysE family translocator [Acetobacteraceae bacterium]
MTATQSLLSFLLAAAVLTVTPGLDTALVLRTAAADGARAAAEAACGVVVGCLLWGGAVAIGLGALLAGSAWAFAVVKWAGAAYLVWTGASMLLRPRNRFPAGAGSASARALPFAQGVLQNLLNPKVGAFYLSFLPQFVPHASAVAPWAFLLACLHAAMGLLWLMALILSTRPLAQWLRRPAVVRRADRAAGCVFLAFGAKLALSRR